MAINKWKTEFAIASGIMAAMIFFLDLITSPVASISLLYVALVLVTLFHPNRLFTLTTTIGVTVLSLVGFIFVPKASLDSNVILNQVISILGIWIAFLFILKFKTQEYGESIYRERLNAMFQHATEGILITNPQGVIVMVNPMAGRQLGYEPMELINKQIETLIPDRMTERHVKHREKYQENARPRPMGVGMQLFAKRKDGSEFPVEISLSNFTTREGRFVIAFLIDITERHKTEELIRQEKELAQRYLDIAPVIFLVIDKQGTITLINQNGCQILGLPENAIIGKNWFDQFIPETSREKMHQLFNNMMNGTVQLVPASENEIVTITGAQKRISWKNTFIRDERGNPVATLCAGEDITERKRQEQVIADTNIELKKYSDEIAQLNEDLEQRVKTRTEELAITVQKLEDANRVLAIQIKEREVAEEKLQISREELRLALNKEMELSELKSRFVTMASHEFRTPLSTILSSASLAGKYNETEQEDKRHKHLDRIKSSVNNLTSILNDFLSLGKLEEGMVSCNPSEFDLVELSNEIVGEMKEVSRKGQEISYKHEGGVEKVLLDKNLTRNICINLLSNAIKYSDEGKPIHFETVIKPELITVKVTDHGIGIPDSEKPHIFERFFRANNAMNIGGTGLGLNIVKKYADLMNGTIRFESTAGIGTTFILELPVLNVNE